MPYVTKIEILKDKNDSKNNLLFQIKILNQEEGTIYFWDLEKFE